MAVAKVVEVGCWRLGSGVVLDLVRAGCITASTGGLRKGGQGGTAIVNSANEQLVGPQRTYFPIGGPCPPDLGDSRMASGSWGGMEAGSNMLYPIQVVDGVIAAAGGTELRRLCAELPVLDPGSDNARCNVGGAVVTKACGALAASFGHVIHCVTPFRSDERWRPLLASTYTSVLSTAAALDPLMELSIPILGSGAKGGEMGEAADVLAEALAGWCFQNAHHADLGLTVRVVCTGRLFAATVEAALDRTIGPLDGADRVG